MPPVHCGLFRGCCIGLTCGAAIPLCNVRNGSRLCENASLDLILGIRFSRDLREDQMKRFVEGSDRGQSTLFPECVADWIGEDNPVRVIDFFVEELDLADLGFGGVNPEVTGRPSYHPAVLLKLYIYGYLNRVQSPARLDPVEIAVNVELQQDRRMIRRPAGYLGIDPAEPKFGQIEFVDKDLDHANRIVLADPVCHAFRKQRALHAIRPLNEALHLILPQIARESYPENQIQRCVFTQPGSMLSKNDFEGSSTTTGSRTVYTIA